VASSPNLTVVTINVGRMLCSRTRRYLEKLMNLDTKCDVILVQDMPFRDLPIFGHHPHLAFGVMTNQLINGERAPVGIAIASRYFITDIRHHTYWGDGILKDLQGVDSNNARFLGEESDRMVAATEDRVVITAAVIKDSITYQLATTHGMWARDGEPNDVQRTSMRRLRDILLAEAINRGGLVIAGDLNFDRGGEIYNMFTAEIRDCTPLNIASTLDREHAVTRKGIKVVSDYFMSCPDISGTEIFDITDVRPRFGVSDHAALWATVSKKNPAHWRG
jgi:hypothetical protein